MSGIILKRNSLISVSMFSLPTHKNIVESISILLIAAALFLCVALIDFHAHGTLVSRIPEEHLLGVIGYKLSYTVFVVFGYGAYILPLALLHGALLIHKNIPNTDMLPRLLFCAGALSFLLGMLGLINAFVPVSDSFPATSGGAIGFAVDRIAFSYFNTTGSVIVLTVFVLVGLHMISEIPDRAVRSIIMAWTAWLLKRAESNVQDILAQDVIPEHVTEMAAASPTIASPVMNETETVTSQEADSRVEPTLSKRLKLHNKRTVKATKKSKAGVSKAKLSVIGAKNDLHQETQSEGEPDDEQDSLSTTPPLELLHRQSDSEIIQHDPKRIRELSEALEKRLADFNVQCQVVNVQPGPIITRYELALAAGTKASKVSGLARDLARSLSIPSVRVVEVIPGKSTIGIEIPNFKRHSVGLRALFESNNFQKAKSPLSLALGVDISGQPVVVDLAKMPHLLVAGTTGSGKSVGLNALLLSMLFRTPPEELRLILIDPKMLEFAVYEGIPHLLTPVVTDMKDAASSLHWCVNEMERRYKLMSDIGVRNIGGYNVKIKEISKLGSYIGASGIEHQGNLPYIVVIADEFADMMMMVGKKVEQLIARLAQKARAAGIHLILATQRPSVDVITGLIKANIPTRLSFQVSSKIDSRTIIDQQGAEALLGSGDMLYLSPGSGVPVRAHGAYVSDEAVQSVVTHLRKTAQPNYIEEITKTDMEGREQPGSKDGEPDSADPLYDQAVDIVVKSRKASISSVQRKLRIGYNRAACLVERMESEGVVSSTEATGQREVLAPQPQD